MIAAFNNKDILVEGKPIFISEWFRKGIVSINELLNETGNVLTLQEFRENIPVNSIFYSIIKLLVLFRNAYGF